MLDATYAGRLLVCAVLSAGGHLLVARGLERLPRLEGTRRPAVVHVRLVAPPPPAPPPPPEPPAPPPPALLPPVVHEPPPRTPRPRPQPTAAATPPTPPTPTAPSERASPTAGPATPVFGISMESTSQAGDGPRVPVGNTLALPERSGKATPGPAAPLAPVPATEVTKMPLPAGACAGRYTDEARAAGVEGTVILDLVVGADGRTRDITVVQGLGHGLTEAAVAALAACRFSSGERDGQPVPVRVRGFKIRFFLNGAD